jgi:hypothetical protein
MLGKKGSVKYLINRAKAERASVFIFIVDVLRHSVKSPVSALRKATAQGEVPPPFEDYPTTSLVSSDVVLTHPSFPSSETFSFHILLLCHTAVSQIFNIYI